MNGRVPCKASCLKKEDPGRQVRNNQNLPPEVLRPEMRNTDGTSRFVSPQHLGRNVEQVRGFWVLGPARDSAEERP